ncbi:hypothetical protein FOA52_003422 [Chlamydomonas sp. UWO 241]|nr:hypothetical protein FOA52_003422 [Chlamydomonas sp. UWO 241]
MALQGAAKNAFLSQFVAMRGSAGVVSGMQAACLSNDEKEHSSSSQGMDSFSRIRSYSTQDLAASLNFNVPAQLRKEQQQRQLGAPRLGFAAAGALLSARAGASSPLLPARRPRSPVALPGQRGMNSWSPAQRYFVEGDHVIQAELNRTFQFTGLDSGSFYPFLVYTVIATAIASVFMIIPWLIAPQRVDLDKTSAYECGFDAFGEARQTFSVSFYLVSIMYLLFDIEICYLLPYVLCHANAQMYWTMNMFLALLVVGFVYEWGVGALEWRS